MASGGGKVEGVWRRAGHAARLWCGLGRGWLLQRWFGKRYDPRTIRVRVPNFWEDCVDVCPSWGCVLRDSRVSVRGVGYRRKTVNVKGK